MKSEVKRPIIRYHGGKWRLAPWIIGHMPAHRTYVEPFCGAASTLLRKSRSYAEVINDLDGQIVNLFRVMRDPDKAKELKRLLELTPFAREEFELSYKESDNDIEQARRTIVRAYMGFGSNAHNMNTGFRANSDRSGTTPAHDWANYPAVIEGIVSRLQGVIIEHRPAVQVIRSHDSMETLIYADPPYVHSTRKRSMQHSYSNEMTDAKHIELAHVLKETKGMVLLSGYDCELYHDLYSGWRCEIKNTHADGAKDRIECLWINPYANSRNIPRLFEA